MDNILAWFCWTSPKAFDFVNHSILLQKHKLYKRYRLTVNWFRAYLSKTTERVSITNTNSEALTTKQGYDRDQY